MEAARPTHEWNSSANPATGLARMNGRLSRVWMVFTWRRSARQDGHIFNIAAEKKVFFTSWMIGHSGSPTCAEIRRYISVGNIQHDDRVALFLMNYPAQRRLKILGHAEISEDDDHARELISKLKMPGEKSVAERAMVVHIEAFDWNCPQHITPRYTEEEIKELVAPLRRRLEMLEEENARLRKANFGA